MAKEFKYNIQNSSIILRDEYYVHLTTFISNQSFTSLSNECAYTYTLEHVGYNFDTSSFENCQLVELYTSTRVGFFFQNIRQFWVTFWKIFW